jgi:hypothetical protein
MFVSSEAARKKVVVRRPFTAHEDATLMRLLINSEVEVDWEAVAKRMDGRSARQCRERWLNYLSPTIRTDPLTDFEDRILVAKINEMGHSWANIGHFFNGRSENDVKNRWYSDLMYRCFFDPVIQKLVLLPGVCNFMFPDRKKRKRVRPLSQQNAIRIIEEEKMAVPGTPVQPGEAELCGDWEPPYPGPAPMSLVDFAAPFDMDEEKQEFPGFLSFGAGFGLDATYLQRG